MRNNSFFKIILIAITVVFFISCDKDFNSIGEDLIGNEHFGLELDSYEVQAYNQKVEAVQSNNLPINPLGIYDDPVFGTTEASFVTQVVLSPSNPVSVNPVIGANPEIESVILNIPYFSHVDPDVAITSSGDSTYILDYIYGPAKSKIKLSVYESGYFMRDLDPLTGFLEPQKFYTDQAGDFNNLIASARLNNDTDVSQNDAFFFNPAERKETTKENEEDVVTRFAPAMRLSLNKDYFKAKIIDAAKKIDGTDPGKLTTNDVFKNFFRGLYFKVEKSGSNPGQMALMNFKEGTITVKYKEDLVTITKDANGNDVSKTDRIDKSIVLNLTGNTVSLLSNTNTPAYDTAINNPNSTTGDSKLYLKGGQGSMAVLDLFNKTDERGYNAAGEPTIGSNHVPDELDDLKQLSATKKLLINEANLVFHIDAATMGANAALPKRIYLYDLTNNIPVLDYLYDGTTGTTVKTGRLIYSGLLNTLNANDPKNYKTYKIRLTNQIRSLVKNKDSVNVKLGVVITEDINNVTMNKLRTSVILPDQETTFSKVPQASIMNPLGVVLFGNNIPSGNADYDKRLRLEIYYTKPD
ncbi:DUF4270 domain-containing protein [Flavobacterium sp. GSA192]|uniref:DUF4270 domain-containing protein n=1 Tax=Flavobacterium sp. GSA192 TaxID=2576304 RepID=UPI00112C47E3|nr:DUF4270 domain-containing protein [Flavobacterium sp. GSA192]